jgi:hypothetical protein
MRSLDFAKNGNLLVTKIRLKNETEYFNSFDATIHGIIQLLSQKMYMMKINIGALCNPAINMPVWKAARCKIKLDRLNI